MKTLSILGSTGSIGKSTLDVIRAHPAEFKVTALTALNNAELLAAQAEEFRPSIVSIFNEEHYEYLRKRLSRFGIKVLHGLEGNIEAACSGKLCITAIVGRAGLIPTLEAISKKVHIRLANKETLVAAGEMVMEAARRKNVSIIPIDSEHSAIFQCLQGHNHSDVKRILLTGSGGPFRTTSSEKLKKVSRAEALNHPVWNMGGKITIDSSTLMNKGLEVIEARWLFNIPYSRISVIIHPQGIVHSMIEFHDGQIIAQMGIPDMKLPIMYALSWPKRLKGLKSYSLDLMSASPLTFEEPDLKRFPCLKLAYQAARRGGTVPASLNAANESAVDLFLKDKAAFSDIPSAVEFAIKKHNRRRATLENILSADLEGRKNAAEFINENRKAIIL